MHQSSVLAPNLLVGPAQESQTRLRKEVSKAELGPGPSKKRKAFASLPRDSVGPQEGPRNQLAIHLTPNLDWTLLTMESRPGAECLSLKFSSANGPRYILATPVPSP